ncbi:MAG: hypothetical protein HGA70_09485 [Chlorobiaceae bacterium]|nr:hypothetical protein [Chlorobiaceae bacterium]
MNRKKIVTALEWVRPAGIAVIIFIANYFGAAPLQRFHILGPFMVMFMSGTVAFESLVLGEAASRKIGYPHNRAYQIQSGLANAAIASTALIVYLLNWGRYAESTIVVAMLAFFCFSAVNHVATAFLMGNLRPVNLMRPVLTLFLVIVMMPYMLQALRQ